jgi:hypothetical protein
MSWYHENLERAKAYAKAYHTNNRDRRNETQRAWRKRTRAERLIALDRKITLAEARKIVQQMDNSHPGQGTINQRGPRLITSRKGARL